MEARFLTHVERTDGCWNWTGSRNELGYGRFNTGDRIENAHRVAYRIWRGDIPKGLVVRHTCVRNRACVNPTHLLLGTQRDNMDDVKRDETANKKLTKAQRDEIRRSDEPILALAERYGVCWGYVYRLKRNLN